MTTSTPSQQQPETSGLDRYFGISRRGSTVGREVRGGIVTFFTMAYILALNPLIIGTSPDRDGNLISGAPKFLDAAQTQVDQAAVGASIGMVGAATALVAGVLTLLMGAVGRFPLGMAAGLGLNALVAKIALDMTWPQAMGLVVWEGILIAVLVLTGFRTAVFKAVPRTLRTAISVGIGLFIAFVGLVDAGVVRPGEGTPVQLGIGGSLYGWPITVFILGLLLLIALHVRRVKGAMLISILAATVLAIIIQSFAKLGPSVASPTGWALNIPELSNFTWPNLSLIGNVDMLGAFTVDGQFSASRLVAAIVLVFSLMLADFFDTMGTIVAVGSEGELLDEEGMPERSTEILMVDSLGAVAGGLGSVSSNTCYIESSSGVAEGARTGLASVVTGLAFLVAILLTPIVNMVPSEAAAPVLVFVGYLMIAQVTDVDWTDPEVAIPAFLTIILMPFTYSITVGIGVGFLAHVFIKLVRGKAREVHPLLYVVALMFILYFIV